MKILIWDENFNKANELWLSSIWCFINVSVGEESNVKLHKYQLEVGTTSLFDQVNIYLLFCSAVHSFTIGLAKDYTCIQIESTY